MIAVLQFDSASVRRLERLVAEGRLPRLTALEEAGRKVPLDTPASTFAAGAFYTLYSGVDLGDHGIFYPFQWDAGAQRIRFATAFEAPPAVWERVAREGGRTLAIDPYEARPPREANGVFASGVGFTDRVVLPRWSLPRGEGRRLRRALGPGPDATEVFGRPSVPRLLRLREVMLRAPERVADAAVALLRREDFDLAWITFAASHVAGHQFWDLSQVDGQGLDPDTARKLRATLDDVYVAVDEAIGRVVDALPPGADVIVTSAVGMDQNTSRADMLPGMLDAALRDGRSAEDPGGGSIWGLRAALPASWRARVAGAVPPRLALELTARLELRGVDWSRTLAFAHPADNQGYVRLNLAGRERDGIVAPHEADALCERIAAGLRSFRDPDGSRSVARVERAPASFSGAHADRLPDLVVHWSPAASSLPEVTSPNLGRVLRQGSGSGRSGNHTSGDAWAIVVPGRSAPSEACAGGLADVAATVCEVTGARPHGLSGAPLLERQPRPAWRSSAKPTAAAS